MQRVSEDFVDFHLYNWQHKSRGVDDECVVML